MRVEPLHILAVDDSPSMRKMRACTLQEAGFHAMATTNSNNAFDKAQQHQPISVVVTGHHLPQPDGLSLTPKLRHLARLRTTPMLIHTTESNAAMPPAGRAANATSRLVKLLDPSTRVNVSCQVALPPHPPLKRGHTYA